MGQERPSRCFSGEIVVCIVHVWDLENETFFAGRKYIIVAIDFDPLKQPHCFGIVRGANFSLSRLSS
jgi:hypothetical protein